MVHRTLDAGAVEALRRVPLVVLVACGPVASTDESESTDSSTGVPATDTTMSGSPTSSQPSTSGSPSSSDASGSTTSPTEGSGTIGSSSSTGWMPTECADGCSPMLAPQSETWASEFIDPPRDGERRVVGVAATTDGRVWAYTQDEQSLDVADERLEVVAADGATAVVLTAADLGLTSGHTIAFAVSENAFVLSQETAGADPFIVSEYEPDGDLVCASAADSIQPFRLVPTPGGDWAMLGYAVPSTEVVFGYLGPACGVAGAWVELQLEAGDEVVALEALDDAFLIAGQRSDGRALVAVLEPDGTERWAWTTDEGPGVDEVLWAARRPDGWLKVGGIMDAEAGNAAFLLDADPSNGDVSVTTFETLVQQPSELNDVRAAFGRSDEWLVFAAGGRYVVQLTDNEPCCPEMIEPSQERPLASQRVGDDLIVAVGDDPDGYDDVRITRFAQP